MAINQPEHRLSHYVCEYLDRVLVGDCWFTAVDTGTYMVKSTPQARFAFENHRRFMGIKPNHLDIYIYQRDTGIFGQFELKVGSNKPTDGQETTMKMLRQRGIPTGCAWAVPEFHALMLDAGFRMHGNAQNIMREVAERHAAAEMAASMKTTKPKRSAKTFKERSSAVKLRKIADIRAKGIRI